MWNPDFAKRKVVRADLHKRLPDLSINMGRAMPIDITQEGMNEAFGLMTPTDVSSIPLGDVIC